eukprot:6175173-Pleurochrysis_carterae.AAC.1
MVSLLARDHSASAQPHSLDKSACMRCKVRGWHGAIMFIYRAMLSACLCKLCVALTCTLCFGPIRGRHALSAKWICR